MIDRFIGKPLTILALSLLACAATAEEARPFESGWYLGGGVSFNDVYLYDDTCWGCYGSAEYGKGDTSGSLAVGFRATEFLDLCSYQLSVLAIAAGRYWEVYLRVGMAFWDAESELVTTLLQSDISVAQSLDRSGEDLLVGVGGGRSFGDGWQVRLDYAFFPIDDQLVGSGENYEAYADYMSLQIIKRFGSE